MGRLLALGGERGPAGDAPAPSRSRRRREPRRRVLARRHRRWLPRRRISGLRPEYRDDYYGAFLRDPDGNNVEAVHHGDLRPGVDHLWLRVADLAASKRFYEGVAPYAGFRLKHESPNRAQFVGERASFSVVAGDPSEHVHIAFPVDDNAVVDAFHGALTDAGFKGQRPSRRAAGLSRRLLRRIRPRSRRQQHRARQPQPSLKPLEELEHGLAGGVEASLRDRLDVVAVAVPAAVVEVDQRQGRNSGAREGHMIIEDLDSRT